jgi:hypothetical protein
MARPSENREDISALKKNQDAEAWSREPARAAPEAPAAVKQKLVKTSAVALRSLTTTTSDAIAQKLKKPPRTSYTPEGDQRLTSNVRQDIHATLKAIHQDMGITIGEQIEFLVENFADAMVAHFEKLKR